MPTSSRTPSLRDRRNRTGVRNPRRAPTGTSTADGQSDDAVDPRRPAPSTPAGRRARDARRGRLRGLRRHAHHRLPALSTRRSRPRTPRSSSLDKSITALDALLSQLSSTLERRQTGSTGSGNEPGPTGSTGKTGVDRLDRLDWYQQQDLDRAAPARRRPRWHQPASSRPTKAEIDSAQAQLDRRPAEPCGGDAHQPDRGHGGLTVRVQASGRVRRATASRSWVPATKW